MVSKLGYRKDSPYKNRKSLTIDSNHITMKDVEFPLLLVPNNDNPVIAKPGEEYMFNNSQYVKEYRLKNMKYGGQTEELLMAYMAKMKPEEQAEFLERFEELGPQEKKMLLNSLRSQMHEVRNKYEEEDYMEMEDQEMEEYMYGGKRMKQGGIYIDPAKRGTFKAQATRMGMGVQEAASKILSNKEDYSPAMVKKANFARNAASWKKEDGGMIEYKMGGELPEYQPGGMTPINPYTKQPLGMVWSDEEKLKTGYYDEVSPQYKLTSSGIAKRAPSELGSATNLRRGANKLGISYGRIPTGRTDFDERGILRPAVNYGDFTDPLNTRPQMTKFKKGGQLPEYQAGDMVPRATVTDTNRPLNPIRPIGWDEVVLDQDQSRAVASLRAFGYSTEAAIEKVLNDPFLAHTLAQDPKGGPGALALLAGAGTTAYFPLVSRGAASGRAVSGKIATGTTSGKAVGASAAGRATGGSKALPPSTSTPLPPLRPDTKALPPSTSVPLPQLPQVRPGSTSTPPPQFRPGSNPTPGTRIPPTPGTPPIPAPPYRSTPTSAPSPSSTSSTFTGVDLGLGMVGAVATGVGVSNARRSAANPPQATMTSDMARFLERQGVPGYRNPTPGMMANQSVRPSASVPSMGQPGAQQVPRTASTSKASNTTVRSQRPSSASIQGDEYVIQKGDTLSQIARRAGIPMETLARLNNIQNVNMIRAGSTLRLRPQQTMQAPDVVPQRAPVESLAPLDARYTFGPETKLTLQPTLNIPKGLEDDLPAAMQNVSRAMAQKPKKRRFFNRRTR